MPVEVRADIEEQGLTALDVNQASLALFHSAAAMIANVPSLKRIVAALVTDVHALAAAPGYDVSHSEPKWRSRVFVSVPERYDSIGAVRLAESVVHEAMHLHLTIFESEYPIVLGTRVVNGFAVATGPPIQRCSSRYVCFRLFKCSSPDLLLHLLTQRDHTSNDEYVKFKPK